MNDDDRPTIVEVLLILAAGILVYAALLAVALVVAWKVAGAVFQP